MLKYSILLSIVLLIAGCDKVTDVFDAIETGAAKQAAKAVKAHCDAFGTNIERRKSFIDAVNAAGKPNVFPWDCDGDGKPDFKAEIELQ